jgi:hypothetical protein
MPDQLAVEPPDGLLPCLQTVLGHDLPNLLVAALGLVRLLESEESHRLSGEGIDYLRRLAAATQRSQALVHALAEIVRAARADEAPQPVKLEELVQEVAAEMKSLFPNRAIDFRTHIKISVLVAPPKGLRQVLSHLCRGAILSVEGPSASLDVLALEKAGGVEIRLSQPNSFPSARPRNHWQEAWSEGTEMSADRLDQMLIRTLLVRWGGIIRFDQGGEGSGALCVWLPPR